MRSVGPIERFDHHRTVPPSVLFDAAGALYQDPERALLYAGKTLSCCLVEVFGATRIVSPTPWHVAVLRSSRPLDLLDLRGSGAMRAGTVAALCKTPERALSQQWSRYVYEHPDLYGAVDGLLYLGAYNDEEAFAIFERAAPVLTCAASEVRPLDHPNLRATVEAAALANDLIVL
jgi:hypothetical protein